MKQLVFNFSARSCFFFLNDENCWETTTQNNPAALGVIITGVLVNSYGNPPHSYETGGDALPLDKDGFPALPTPPNGKNTISGAELAKLLPSLKVTATPRQQKWFAERLGNNFPQLPNNQTHVLSLPVGTVTKKIKGVGGDYLQQICKRCGITLEVTGEYPKLKTTHYKGILNQTGGAFYLNFTEQTAANELEETVSITEEPGDTTARRAVELIAFELGVDKIVTVCG